MLALIVAAGLGRQLGRGPLPAGRSRRGGLSGACSRLRVDLGDTTSIKSAYYGRFITVHYLLEGGGAPRVDSRAGFRW
jgi:hypothetical protein